MSIALNILSLIVVMVIVVRMRVIAISPITLIVASYAFYYVLPSLFVKSNVGSVDVISVYSLIFILVVGVTSIYMLRGVYVGHRSASAKIAKPYRYILLLVLLLLLEKVILAGYGYVAGDVYLSLYSAYHSMPLPVAQAMRILRAVSRMALIFSVISVALRSDKRAQMYWLIAGIVIGNSLYIQARKDIVFAIVIIVSALFIVNWIRGQRIHYSRYAFVALLLYFSMGVFGLLRGGMGPEVNASIIGSEVLSPGEAIFIYSNAESMLSNVSSVYYSGPPGSTYLQPLLSWIPSQINSSKWDINTWYVQTYYRDYFEQSGGLAFGSIPEATVAFGLWSIILQAIILSIIYSLSIKWLIKTGSIVAYANYLYLSGTAYLSVRSYTLVMVSDYVLGFLIPLLLLILVTRLKR